MANFIYGISEAQITWKDTGGTELLTLTSLAAAAGRQGALHDFNFATAKSIRYRWRFYCQFATAPVLKEVIRIYWKAGDGTHYDNDDGTGDIAVSAIAKLDNLHQIGTLVVDEAVLDIEMSVSGIIWITEEVGGPVIWNATADALTATAAEHGFTLTPIPDQIQ